MNKKVIIFGSLGAVAVVSTSVAIPFVLKKNRNNSKIKAANASISKVVALFDELKNKEEGTVSTLTNKSSTLPSSLVDKTTAEALGFADPSIDKLDGTTVSFAVKSDSANDEEGKLIVEVAISKRLGTTKKVDFTLTGFQTTSQRTAIEAANTSINTVIGLFNTLRDNGGVTSLASKATTLPSELSGATTASALGFTDPSVGRTDGTTITFAVKSHDDGDGTLVVTATIAKTLGITQTVEFTLRGFQTNSQRIAIGANTSINTVIGLFNTLRDNGGRTSLASKATTLPSELSGATTASALGFTDPSAGRTDGTTITFAVKSHDDSTGNLVVTATVAKFQGTTQTVDFTLTGFQTTSQRTAIEAANTSINTVIGLFNTLRDNGGVTSLASKATTLPSELSGATTASALGFTDPSVGRTNGTTITFAVTSYNNAAGALSVTATVYKTLGITQTVDFTLRGFQTTSQRIAIEANTSIDTVIGLFNTLRNNGGVTSLASKATTLPSELSSATTASALGFTDPSVGKTDGTTITFAVKSHDDGAGTLVVTATVAKFLGVNQTVDFTLRGFQTTSQRTAIEAANTSINTVIGLFNTLRDNGGVTSLASKATTLPSELSGATTASALGFTDPSVGKTDGTTITFAVTSYNNAAGALSVTATVYKTLGITQTVDFTLTGFQTTSQRNA